MRPFVRVLWPHPLVHLLSVCLPGLIDGRSQVSSVVVAYATASSSVDDGAAVGITLSQLVPASSQPDSQLQQPGAVSDVRLEFVRIPLLRRGHQLYHWTRCDGRTSLLPPPVGGVNFFYRATLCATVVCAVVVCPSVRPSVCPVQAGTVPRRLNRRSHKQRHLYDSPGI